LLTVHTKEYLESLKSSRVVAQITEVFVCAVLPNWLVKSRVLNPFLYATSGSILAAKVAMEKGCAINLGGGYHHCCGYQGGGFCAYADITLSLMFMRKCFPSIKKVMIIDLDAHQGNGHERDKIVTNDKNLYIMDMYNPFIYPGDVIAKRAIDLEIKVESGSGDDIYLPELETGLATAFKAFTPDAIFYNAGTDILEDDPLGQLNVSQKGVITRDEMVFKYATDRKIPLIMLLSGGYQQSNAEVIAKSIKNLQEKFNILSIETIQESHTEKNSGTSTNEHGEHIHKKQKEEDQNDSKL